MSIDVLRAGLFAVAQAAAFLLVAPLLHSLVKKMKAGLQLRQGPPLLQGHYDLAKLLRKQPVRSTAASWVFVAGPRVYFATALTATLLVPALRPWAPLESAGGILVLVGLLALGRFALALAALDTGSPFGGMGASREMTIASLAEPAMLMAIFTISLGSQTTSLAQVVRSVQGGDHLLLRPSFAFAILAFVLIALAETGRIPVDNPATHLELTMIHEAMVLEYSGRHLALVEWAGMMKLALFAYLGIAAFFPWGIAASRDLRALGLAFAAMVLKLAAIGCGIVLIETGLAKMRIFRLTEFLGAAFLMATLGMLSFFILE